MYFFIFFSFFRSKITSLKVLLAVLENHRLCFVKFVQHTRWTYIRLPNVLEHRGLSLNLLSKLVSVYVIDPWKTLCCPLVFSSILESYWTIMKLLIIELLITLDILDSRLDNVVELSVNKIFHLSPYRLQYFSRTHHRPAYIVLPLCCIHYVVVQCTCIIIILRKCGWLPIVIEQCLFEKMCHTSREM